VIKEDYENAPPETRIVGRVLFLDLHTPASRIEDAATWSAVLASDGDNITFWQTYAGGHTLAWPCPRTKSYAEATNEGPHPLSWLMAARLLGLPFPGEEGAGGQSPHSSPRPLAIGRRRRTSSEIERQGFPGTLATGILGVLSPGLIVCYADRGSKFRSLCGLV
jgi:hypothetical protein